MTNSLISVIIPAYNRSRTIERCLRSVLHQTYAEIEVIVIDDCSTDDTIQLINNIDDPRIILFKNEENRGAGFSRNRGIEEAKGEYIAFQDSDDEWLPDKLEKEMAALRKHDVDAVYCDVYFVDQNGNKTIRIAPDIEKGKVVNDKTLDYQVHNLTLITLLVKKKCLLEVGGFDQRFKNLIDLDLYIRLAKRYHFYHLNQPLAIYHFTAGISSSPVKAASSRMLLIEKYRHDLEENPRWLAHQYYNIATCLAYAGKCPDAGKYYRRAISIYPWNPRYYLLFLASVLGNGFFATLVKLKKKLTS